MVEKRKKRSTIQTVDLSSHLVEFVKYRIPTGNIAFDIVTGGGIPAGKLSEIYGDFASGKSRIALHICAQTIKLGGVAVYMDLERSIDRGLLDLTGVDPGKLVYPNPDQLRCVEDVFDVLEIYVHQLRDQNPDGFLTIVWDSVASTPGIELLEGQIGVNTTALRRAKLIGEGLQKIMADVYQHKICLIFINQIRDRINVMYGDKYDTVGGKAIKFTASMRIHCKLAGKLKNDKTMELDGYKGRIVIDKSKVCKPFGVVNFEMYTDRPIDKYSGLLDYYIRHSLVESSGTGWYNLPGSEDKFRKDDFPTVYEEKINGKETNT